MNGRDGHCPSASFHRQIALPARTVLRRIRQRTSLFGRSFCCYALFPCGFQDVVQKHAGRDAADAAGDRCDRLDDGRDAVEIDVAA